MDAKQNISSIRHFLKKRHWVSDVFAGMCLVEVSGEAIGGGAVEVSGAAIGGGAVEVSVAAIGGGAVEVSEAAIGGGAVEVGESRRSITEDGCGVESELAAWVAICSASSSSSMVLRLRPLRKFCRSGKRAKLCRSVWVEDRSE